MLLTLGAFWAPCHRGRTAYPKSWEAKDRAAQRPPSSGKSTSPCGPRHAVCILARRSSVFRPSPPPTPDAWSRCDPVGLAVGRDSTRWRARHSGPGRCGRTDSGSRQDLFWVIGCCPLEESSSHPFLTSTGGHAAQMTNHLHCGGWYAECLDVQGLKVQVSVTTSTIFPLLI